MDIEEQIRERYAQYQPQVDEQEWEQIRNDRRLVRHNRWRKWHKAWIGGGVCLLAVIAVTVTIALHRSEQLAKTSSQSQTVTETATAPTENGRNQSATLSSENTHSDNVEQADYQNNTSQNSHFVHNGTTSDEPAVAAPTHPVTAPAAATASAPNQSLSPMPTVLPAQTVTSNVVQPAKTKVHHDSQQTTANLPQKNSPQPDEERLVESKLFVPSAFTPNGDGLNDQFLVTANFEPATFEITIFTRSNDKVFHARSMEIGWDGTRYGTLLPQGVYLYLIKYTNEKGQVMTKKGQVLLLN